MPPPPQVVLFDADGVVQQTPPGWEEELHGTLGSPPYIEELLRELFTAELPALAGGRDFADVVREVLGRWDLADRTEDVLAYWTRLELDAGVTALIGELRAAGAACFLATNQHELRRAYMSTSLGYDDLLDGQLYSCDLGVAKPDPAYFTAALERIGYPAGAALFIDDREPNVLGARTAGLRAEVFHLSSGADALRTILAAHGLL
jgi:HAD superfamily hydrolase (TIGR01509 family)